MLFALTFAASISSSYAAPRPASAYDVPYTQVLRPRPPYHDFGAHDLAVRAFVAGRMLDAFEEPYPDARATYYQEHTHKEIRLDPRNRPSYGVYANQTMYAGLREPANPQPSSVAAVLYAPTMFGPGLDCIEAVNVYLPQEPPEIWAWNWCANVADQPAVTIAVGPRFVSTYVGKAPSGLPEYAVETLLGRDGKTWNMVIYNRRTKKWDLVAQAAGSRATSGFPYGPRGWDMYEMYSGVDAETQVATACVRSDIPIGSDGLAISFDPSAARAFTPASKLNAEIGRFQDFHCPKLVFHLIEAFSDWNVTD